jgi:hypothetical protein
MTQPLPPAPSQTSLPQPTDEARQISSGRLDMDSRKGGKLPQANSGGLMEEEPADPENTRPIGG